MLLCHPSKSQTSHEASNEAAASQPLCQTKTQQGQRDDGNLQPRIGDPATVRTRPQGDSTEHGEYQTRHDADPDHLESQFDSESGRFGGLDGAGCKCQKEQDYGHADPVVQTTFDIQALPYLVGHGGVRDNSLSQGGIRRCEHRGDQGDFVEAEITEYEKAQTQAECDRQRQANQEQSNRNGLDASQYAQVGIRGICKQADGEREFGQTADCFAIELQVDQAKTLRAKQHACGDIHERTVDRRFFESRRDQAVDERECSEDCQDLIFGHACSHAPSLKDGARKVHASSRKRCM